MPPSVATVIEQGLPLSQSFIWKLQCQFYESLGIEAWLSGVIPSKITTNSFIARTFARLIAAYAADIEAEELTIVELGAGHGRFGFLCATHLAEMAAGGLLPARNWRYVLTDVAERNIKFWQAHEALRPLADERLLDFSRFEAGVDTQLELRESGQTIGPRHKAGPLVVIGNYFFDSLPIDVFQIEEGTLYECRPILSAGPGATCTDRSDTAILEQLQLDWDRYPVPQQPYARADLTELVAHFATTLGDTAFTIPVGAIDTLSTIEQWSDGRQLLLVADKGYTRECDLQDRPLPTMVQHGCFSFSVNFCALGRWFAGRGGTALLPTFRDTNLELAAFARAPDQDGFRSLRLAFDEGAAAFSPGDFHQVTRRVGRDGAQPELRHCLSLLRLSCYEPQLLYALRRAIRGQLAEAGESDCQAVREVLAKAAALYFHLDDCDVPFAIAHIYQELGDYAEAIEQYRRSLRIFGADPTTLTNLAACLLETGSADEALACVVQALQIDPDFTEAAELKQRIVRDFRPQAAALTGRHESDPS